MASQHGFSIRPAKIEDVPAINDIHAYYVLHTVTNFRYEPVSVAAAKDKFTGIVQSGLPYLVAIDDEDQSLIGFTLVAPFRGAFEGYAHTVELSLFCRPGSTSRGAGSALLDKLVDVLQHHEKYDDAWISGKWRTEEGKVCNIIACMALDTTAPKGGWALKEWYEKRGFEMSAHLKKVGRKFDRWIDTVYLQRFL